MLASTARDNAIRIWDFHTGESLFTIKGHTGEVSELAFFPDGLTLASGSWDRTVRLWDSRTGENLKIL